LQGRLLSFEAVVGWKHSHHSPLSFEFAQEGFSRDRRGGCLYAVRSDYVAFSLRSDGRMRPSLHNLFSHAGTWQQGV